MESISKKIILASASPRRKELLEKENYLFEVCPSSAEEEVQRCVKTFEIAKSNALLKANDIAQKFPARLVLGADTIVVLNGKVYGKPKDLQEAFKMLSELQGRTHSVFTAIALVCVSKEIERVAVDESKVTFKKMDEAAIKNYLSKVYVLDKAGAYAAQEFGELIIEKIDGQFDNVMGLPCRLLKDELDSINF